MKHQSRIRVALLLIAASYTFGAATSFAQEQHPDSESVNEARELFQRAGALLESGEFASAEVLFRRSLELAPRPSTAFNLAVTLRGIGRLHDAIQLLEKLSAGRFGELAESRRDDVRTLQEAIAPELGELRLTLESASPTRTEVSLTVDGEELMRSPLPIDHALSVDPGTHRVQLSGVDLQTVHREVNVPPGQSVTLEIILASAVDTRPGHLTLTSSDADATLRIEGVAEGVSPLARELTPGEYVVSIHNRHGSRESRIAVPSGRPVRLDLTAPPPSARRRRWILAVLGVALVAGATFSVVYWQSQREGPPRESNDFPHVQALHSW